MRSGVDGLAGMGILLNLPTRSDTLKESIWESEASDTI
jgi:hypothetical protein